MPNIHNCTCRCNVGNTDSELSGVVALYLICLGVQAMLYTVSIASNRLKIFALL